MSGRGFTFEADPTCLGSRLAVSVPNQLRAFKPFEAPVQIGVGIVEVNDTPVLWFLSNGGGVDRQWTHQQSASLANLTRTLEIRNNVGMNAVLIEPSMEMRACDDTQSTVADRTVVEVQPDCKHLFQHFGRRLNMLNAFFY